MHMNDRKSHIENSQIGSKAYALSGLAIIAFGVWAVLAPFVGTGETWTSNFNHVMLSVLPGAAAALGGLMMLSRRPQLAWIGGLVALAGGVWFMVGPMTYPLWPSGGVGTGPAPGGSVWLAQWIAFFFVSGGVITLLSVYALGFGASDDVFDEEAGTGHREPVTPEHARRRPFVRQPAERRQRPHAQPSRDRARHGS
jgi:FtsH-binding integral membrane protein